MIKNQIIRHKLHLHQTIDKKMKNLNSLYRGALLIGLLILYITTSEAQTVTAYTYAFSIEPTIDGVIDESWADNDFLEISKILSSDKTITSKDFSGEFKISWYNNDLYFLIVVTDDILILNEEQPLWHGDNVNLFLDLGNEKSTTYDNNDYLCHFKWGNSDFYQRYDGIELVEIENSETAIEFAQTYDTMNHEFILEIAIHNVAELNGPSSLNESTSVGLDVGIYDSDDPGYFTEHFQWVDTTSLAWSDPSKLGTTGLGTAELKAAKVHSAINNSNRASSLKVYPTLVSDKLYIQTTQSKDINIEVINILGERVQSIVLRSENSSIDVSTLKTGLYFVNVYDSKGLITTHKISVFR